jgi:hypothetical protein
MNDDMGNTPGGMTVNEMLIKSKAERDRIYASLFSGKSGDNFNGAVTDNPAATEQEIKDCIADLTHVTSTVVKSLRSVSGDANIESEARLILMLSAASISSIVKETITLLMTTVKASRSYDGTREAA